MRHKALSCLQKADSVYFSLTLGVKPSSTGDAFNKDLFSLNDEDDASTEEHPRFSSESKTVPVLILKSK